GSKRRNNNQVSHVVVARPDGAVQPLVHGDHTGVAIQWLAGRCARGATVANARSGRREVSVGVQSVRVPESGEAADTAGRLCSVATAARSRGTAGGGTGVRGPRGPRPSPRCARRYAERTRSGTARAMASRRRS